MCRNIKTLFNFEPPATHAEIHASALQFVRKLSGFNSPSQANAEAFNRAVSEVSDSARRLLASLQTNAPARDREIEAEKAKKAHLRNEPKAVGQALSKDWVPGSCVRLKGRDYAVLETSDGNVILSPANASVATKASEVASPSENAA